MQPCLPNSRRSRRGITLLEMLVAVALLVLMMTIVTSIFQAATGAITVAKTFQELDGNLRQLDSVMRQDLDGATADTGSGPLTPPFNPELNLGYFELGENQFADLQGEDSDDYIRFTVKAPEGQPFTGRMWLGPVFLPSPPFPANTPSQPVMIQSQYAEVIYFLRNQNLYRRVFLVAPERQQAVVLNYSSTSDWQFPATAFNGITVGWQGLNDISARPSTVVTTVGGNVVDAPPVLNTLADLTNRENRAFYPRFSNDYLTFNPGTSSWQLGPDGTRDDINPLDLTSPVGDSVADWWPTLYPNVFNTGLVNPTQVFLRQPNTNSNAQFSDLMSFPYTFPGAFSQPDPTSGSGLLHGMGNHASAGNPADTGDPMFGGVRQNNPYPPPYGRVYANGSVFATSPATVYQPNHNPVSSGDTLSTPDSPVSAPAAYQTWWGFPTWKETMSPSWTDPVLTLFRGLTVNGGRQSTGLSWFSMNNGSAVLKTPFVPPLPPLTDPTLDLQEYNDGLGATTFGTPATVFRDDIIMQGVRSFDVKVYDNTVPGYVDLGYSNYVDGVTNAIAKPNTPLQLQLTANLLSTMGHEGRIPPLTTDYRSDPNYPNWLPNIGDDTAGINRLRRVWDTWSTDYSNAPATGLVPGSSPPTLAGPPFSQPIYPSYPPPYATALRGIQIQIRVVDPRNERIKVLTIRHSFSS